MEEDVLSSSIVLTSYHLSYWSKIILQFGGGIQDHSVIGLKLQAGAGKPDISN